MDLAQIQKRIEMMEELQRETREAKEMLKEELENDERYREVLEEANEVNAKKKRIKEEIENGGSNKKLLQTIKDNAEELATLKEILTAELVEVYAEQKVDEITDANGDVRKFKLSVRLMGRGSYNEGRDSFGKYSKEEDYIDQ